MEERQTQIALVLHTVRWRESDLIVDLLTEEGDRLSVLARHAKSSRRRFGAALELGTRIRATWVSRGERSTLTECSVLRPVFALSQSLDQFYSLNFVLEIARLTTHEGLKAPQSFRLIDQFIEVASQGALSFERLVLWQIAMFEALGYALRFDRDSELAGSPDAVALLSGGAVGSQNLAPELRMQVKRVPPSLLLQIAALQNGRLQRLPLEHRVPIQQIFDHLWGELTGRALKTSGILAQLWG